MAYAIEGRLLEACSCGGPCPCWVGEDPDGGSCEGMLGYHYDRGKINDIDVSGLTLALLAHIPGNILKGNWKVVAYVDSKATPEQKDAILNAHFGKLGGPLADPLLQVGIQAQDLFLELLLFGSIPHNLRKAGQLAPFITHRGQDHMRPVTPAAFAHTPAFRFKSALGGGHS